MLKNNIKQTRLFYTVQSIWQACLAKLHPQPKLEDYSCSSFGQWSQQVDKRR